jgi:hypothetical protein
MIVVRRPHPEEPACLVLALGAPERATVEFPAGAWRRIFSTAGGESRAPEVLAPIGGSLALGLRPWEAVLYVRSA